MRQHQRFSNPQVNVSNMETDTIMSNFFVGLNSVSDIKKHYREFCKLHHPDLGGDTATMQAINTEYAKALKSVDGSKTFDEHGKEHTYHYNQETEDQIARKLMELLALKMDNTDIWLIGVWVWLKGDTKPHREALKSAGCRWHAKNLAWYYRPEEYRSWHSGKGLGTLAAQYGAQKITDIKEKEARKAIAR